MNQLALLFPGQGSQYSGMGKRVYDLFPKAKQTFEEASDILGRDMIKLCLEGSSQELSQTENTQVALYTTCMAMFYAYEQEIGIVPSYVAGHSLGEYAALTSAGVIEFRDGLNLVSARAKFMQEAIKQNKGVMCVILGISSNIVKQVCERYVNQVVISNYNSPEQVVLSGNKEVVQVVSTELEQMGARVFPLEIKAPFHSFLMQEAAVQFKNELNKYTFNETRWPVISNITGLPYDTKDLQELLAEQILKPVQWEKTMDFLLNMSVERIVEIGPRMILKNLAKENCPRMATYSYDNENDVNILMQSVNQTFDHSNAFLFIEKCVAAVVCTRNRNWNDTEYQAGVAKPYKEVKEMYYLLKDNGAQATMEQVEKAKIMLINALNTKMVPEEEQKSIYQEISGATGIECADLNLAVHR
ncbi:ACP S-malonyltransferase [Paenibacillus sp. LMG 31461]|uniref:[acyl-carrier-protein] S-malonyltransferase n=1 Tax=Paenibacillus plantarum TaxID=2654975 RepID=A0ABX1X4C6_9BACL|nr:ACP S-malonyltransferase [Paenibacillus plantarum]NOU63265.1 ACP S-malonyltransferase [Paenibacillus plantarum]